MKTTIITGIIILVSVFVVAALFIFWPGGEPEPDSQTPTPQFPSSPYQSTVTPVGQGGDSQTTAPATMAVPAAEGTPIQTTDVTEQTGVTEDPANPGIYYLAGGSVSSDTYTIAYHEADGSFTVALFAEPLGEVRRAAEQDLVQQLGISQYDACRLRYEVLTPYWVNPIYTGKNLGFSFCPGATPL